MPILDQQKRLLAIDMGIDPDEAEELPFQEAPPVEQPALKASPKIEQTVSPLTSLRQEAIRSGPSAVAGLALGGAATTGLSAAGIPPIASIPAGIGVGIGGAIGTRLIQDKIAEILLPKEWSEQYRESEIANYAQNPVSSAVGSVGANLIAMKPDPKSVATAGRALIKPLRGGTLTAAEKNAALNVGLGASIPAATTYGAEAYQQGDLTPEIDPMRLAIDVVGGALINNPNKIGKSIGLTPNTYDERPMEGIAAKHKQSKIVPPIEDENARLYEAEYEAQPYVQELRARQRDIENKKKYTKEFKQLKKEEYEANKAFEIAQEEVRSQEADKSRLEESKRAEEASKIQRDLSKTRAADYIPAKTEELIENPPILQPIQEVKPKPTVITETGKEIYPDYTGTQEIDTEINAKEPLTEAEIIQDEYDRGIRQQEASTVEKIQEGAKAKGLPLKNTEAWKQALTKLGVMRGVNVKTEVVKAPNQIDEIAGETALRDGLKQTIAKINPNKANVDTWPHELFHVFRDDLKTKGNTLDRSVISKADAAIASSEEFKTWFNKLPAKSQYRASKEIAIEEFITTKVGEDFVRRHLGTDNKGRIGNAIADVWSNVKTKFGKATPEDYARLLSYRLTSDPSFSERFGGEIKTQPKITEDKKNQEESNLSKKVAPVVYKGVMENPKTGFKLHLYDLTEDIVDPKSGEVLHPKGSTVSQNTLSNNGFEIPAEMPKTPEVKGQEQSRLQVDTPEFKKWFEGSKVVDKEGKPLRVYHGTDGDFTIFKQAKEGSVGKGIYVTPKPEVASGYAFESANAEQRKGGNNIKPLYISLKQPLEISLKDGINPAEVALRNLGLSKEKARDIAEKALESKGNITNEIQSRAIKAGFDGIIVREKDENIREAVAFDARQIKSATGNQGTFDPNNPDIRYQESSRLSNESNLVDDESRQAAAQSPVEVDTLPKSEHDASRLPGFNVIRSSIDKIKDQASPKVADGFRKFYDQQKNLTGSLLNKFSTNVRSLVNLENTFKAIIQHPKEYWKQDSQELNNVRDYLWAKYDGEELPTLSENEEKILAEWQRTSKLIRDEQRKRAKTEDASKGLRAIDEDDEFYFPQRASMEVIKELTQKPNSDKTKQLRDEFIKHQAERIGGENATKKAESNYEELLKGFNKKDLDIASQFGPIDKAEGYGLPKSWRDKSFLNTTQHYLDRVVRRFAYYDAIQKPGLEDEVKKFAGNDLVKPVLNDITGNRMNDNPFAMQVAGLVRAGMMGTLTGAKDFTSALTLGFQHQQNPIKAIQASLKGLSELKESIAEASELGRIRHHMNVLEWDGGYTDSIRNLRRIRDVVSDITGRNFLDKAARGMAMGQGKFATIGYHQQYLDGTLGKQGKKFFEDFAKDIDWKKEELTLDEVKQVAARYVDSSQGAYDPTGLPAWALQGELAPFFSLARWSIEKSNNYVKNVVNPAINDNNWMPFLLSTMGIVTGGALVSELQEAVTGRKQKTATLKELEAARASGKDTKLATTYKMMGLATAAGHVGIIGDTIKSILDVTYGKNRPQVFNNVLFELAENTATTMGNLAKSIMDYGWDGETVFNSVTQLLEDNFQTYRIIESQISAEKKEDIEQANKIRDLRVFNTLDGNAIRDLSNPFSRPAEDTKLKKFKRATTFEEAAEVLPELLQRALKKADGNVEKLTKELSRIKRNSYQTMPSPERWPLSAREYYLFLSRTQGEEAATKRMMDYIKRNSMNKAKAEMVPDVR